jgi:hypothetical protein
MSRMAISSSLFLLMLLVPQSAGSAQSASDVWTTLPRIQDWLFVGYLSLNSHHLR